jgi:hypothetical protein
MQEIVPPKLNKDSGLLSLLLNRRNIIIAIGFGASLLLWSGFKHLSTDQKIILEIAIGGFLVPLLIDIHGRPMHRFISDAFKYYLRPKKQRTILAKDISEGVLISPDGTYSQIYRIEPINLSMSSEEEINAFKTYIQQALFSLKTPIQILTLQRYSFNDKNLNVEITRVKKLTGTLQRRAKEYLDDYINLNQTMERSFFLVYTVTAKSLDTAKRKLEDQQTFIRLLETTKVKLTSLETPEILELADYILPKTN